MAAGPPPRGSGRGRGGCGSLRSLALGHLPGSCWLDSRSRSSPEEVLPPPRLREIFSPCPQQEPSLQSFAPSRLYFTAPVSHSSLTHPHTLDRHTILNLDHYTCQQAPVLSRSCVKNYSLPGTLYSHVWDMEGQGQGVPGRNGAGSPGLPCQTCRERNARADGDWRLSAERGSRMCHWHRLLPEKTW